MAPDLRTSAAALAVTVACVLVVVVRVLGAPDPQPRRAATEAERLEIAQSIASSEGAWMQEAMQHFPEDHWSQRDDFHGRELRQVIEIVKQRGVRIEDVLRAIDEDIHRQATGGPAAPERHAHAVPCKPRPFYD
jgi:hypothetical protein